MLLEESLYSYHSVCTVTYLCQCLIKQDTLCFLQFTDKEIKYTVSTQEPANSNRFVDGNLLVLNFKELGVNSASRSSSLSNEKPRRNNPFVSHCVIVKGIMHVLLQSFKEQWQASFSSYALRSIRKTYN